MGVLEDKFVKLSKQLLPTGRAFRGFFNMEKLFRAFSWSEAEAYRTATSILDSIIPDNDNFTADDATDWERRLGIISNSLVPLADRKAAILRKMKAPGTNPAKGHYLYIEQQLQAAGFNVYVYENIFSVYPTGFLVKNPAVLNPLILSNTKYGNTKYGGKKYGGYLNHLVVNSLDNNEDTNFNLGQNLRATFFIGAGPGTPGAYANVLATREQEFRQLILALKQTQNVAILFINYI